MNEPDEKPPKFSNRPAYRYEITCGGHPFARKVSCDSIDEFQRIQHALDSGENYVEGAVALTPADRPLLLRRATVGGRKMESASPPVRRKSAELPPAIPGLEVE